MSGIRKEGVNRGPLRSGDNPVPPKRSEIRVGSFVWVVEKENYGKNVYTQGVVKEILTSAGIHPRGVKVRLMDGTVGRVQWLGKDVF